MKYKVRWCKPEWLSKVVGLHLVGISRSTDTTDAEVGTNKHFTDITMISSKLENNFLILIK